MPLNHTHTSLPSNKDFPHWYTHFDCDWYDSWTWPFSTSLEINNVKKMRLYNCEIWLSHKQPLDPTRGWQTHIFKFP